MARVNLSYTQTVALDAQTLVLEKVSFKAGSNVTLTSSAGILSTPTSMTGITRGWVNVLPEVMYGTHDLHALSNQMTTHGQNGTAVNASPSRGIPVDNFRAAVTAQFGAGLENLNLRKK
jgi:hypothetical protein